MMHDSPATRRLGALASAAALLLSGCSALVGADPPEPLIIGVDLDLTGRSGGLDSVFEQALHLRVEQLNQQRERSGGRRVELRMLDNASDTDTSVANVAELAAEPRVSGVITGGCGQCVIAAAHAINTAAVPVISLASEDEVAEPVAGRRFIFRLGPDAAGSADVMATALADRDVTTIGLVTSDDQYGSDGAGELGEAAATLDIDVPVQEVFEGNEDLAEVAGRIVGWTPELDPFAPPLDEPVGLDAVVLWTPEQQAVELAVALREAGWDGPLWLDMAAAGDLFYVGLEGVIAKRLNSRYRPGRRSPDWVKVPLVRTQEVVVVGWTPGAGRRQGMIGSLLLGARDQRGDLVYVGQVGTGFTDAALRDLAGRLHRLTRPDPPLAAPAPRDRDRQARWVEPVLVAEVAFRTWSPDRRLRHPSWRGLRPDRDPAAVYMEQPR